MFLKKYFAKTNSYKYNKLTKGLCLGLAFQMVLILSGCGSFEGSSTVDSEAEKQIVLTTGFAKDEIFRIGDASCRLPEAMVYLTTMQNEYESVYGEKIWDRKIGDMTVEEKIKSVVLARMAQIKTMNLLAQQRGITLSQKELAAVDNATEIFYSSLNDTERDTLAITEELVRGLYTEYAMAGKVYEQIIEETNPEISDDEARTVTLSQIYVKTFALDGNGKRTEYTKEGKELAKDKARTVYNKLKNGEDFDQLATTYNEGQSITISFGKDEVNKTLEEAAFNLGTDEISPLIETEDGYYILKCISTLDRDQTDLNKEKILKERKEQAFSQVYEQFQASQIRNFNEELWESVHFVHNLDISTKTFFDVYNENGPDF